MGFTHTHTPLLSHTSILSKIFGIMWANRNTPVLFVHVTGVTCLFVVLLFLFVATHGFLKNFTLPELCMQLTQQKGLGETGAWGGGGAAAVGAAGKHRI